MIDAPIRNRSLERGKQRADSESHAGPKSDAEYYVAKPDPTGAMAARCIKGTRLVMDVPRAIVER
jgi:hypothetical protein